MPRCLILRLNSGRQLRGEAVLRGHAPETWEFESAADMVRPVTGYDDLNVIAQVPGPLVERELHKAWPGAPGSIALAADAAYLLGLTEADSLDELELLATNLADCLAQLPDDLLAQMAELVREGGLQQRLGWLETELHRRFDVLNVPPAGEVDMAAFYPARSDGTASRHDLPTDLLERLFGANKSLETAFEGYEERPQQQEMASIVSAALESGTNAVIEAGTGVGKSLAYLLPLALHSARTGKLCLVSTNTINLQQQLLESDVPKVRRALDNLDLRISLLKGREHYLCLKRLHDGWLSSGPAIRQRQQLLATGNPGATLFLLRLLFHTVLGTGGDIDEIVAPEGLSQRDRLALSATLDCRYKTCLGDRCEYKGNCHYFSRRDEALRSNIVITNHALVSALYTPDATESDNIVSRASVIVFDEAHNLESAITNQSTLEVNDTLPVDLGNRLLEVVQKEAVRHRLRQPVSSVGEPYDQALGRAQQAAAELPRWVKTMSEIRAQVNSLLEQAAGVGAVSGTDHNQLSPATAEGSQAKIIEILGKLAARLLAVVDRYLGLGADLTTLLLDPNSDMYIEDDSLQMDLQALVVDLTECRSALQNWKPEDPGKIAWFNCSYDGEEPRWEYKTAPLKIGPLFQSLASQMESVVLTSATLTVENRFDYLKQSLGFDEESAARGQWSTLTSPFDYAKQALLLVATDMARPTGDARYTYLSQLTEVVEGAAQVFDRGVLVLFNSYRDLNHVADELDAALPAGRLLIQGVSGSRHEIADRFRKSGDKVLLATRSFWEGFDVVGDALSCVVLAKLPFANYRDPIHAGRQRAIEADGGDSFRQYSLPLAATLLKQGFGRLIRSRQDRGCVFLLDSRAAQSSYGKVFLGSLPGPASYSGPYRSCLDRAAEFMGATVGSAGV